MSISIYSQTGGLKITANPGSSSQCTQELQGDSILSLSFESYEYVALDVNDYVDFYGDRYWLAEQYRPKEESTRKWKYDVHFYGTTSLIKRYLVVDHADGDANPVFSLTAPASQHVRMIVECLNNATGTNDWKVGEVVETGNIVIDYFGKYCDEGLRELAETAGTEFWLEGTTVNLCRCEYGEILELGYGNGLINLERGVADNTKFYTRLYPVGSSRNIDPDRYGHTRLQLPNGRKYVDLEVDKYGIVDHYEQEAFTGIYPRYTGTVSDVRVEERTDDEGTAFRVYFFRDSALPFDPNDYLMPNEPIHVSFQTGELQGLGQTDDHYFEADYNSETGEFEIINIWTDGEQLPDGRLIPAVGDRFIPWNISMPDTYYTLAEQEFLAAVENYNANHFVDISVYRGRTDHVWVEGDQLHGEDEVEFYLGRRVRLASDEYFPGTGYRDSRITKIIRRLDLPTLADIEISDAVSKGSMTKITDDIKSVRRYAEHVESFSIPGVIQTGDNTKFTDFNVLSALRATKEFLSKKYDDVCQGLIGFKKGAWFGSKAFGVNASGDATLNSVNTDKVISSNYSGDGMFDTGYKLQYEKGRAKMVTDDLVCRGKFVVNEIEDRIWTYVGGNLIFSAAGSTILCVEYLDANGVALGYTYFNSPWMLKKKPLLAGIIAWAKRKAIQRKLTEEEKGRVVTFRCYETSDDGTMQTRNWWHPDDLAYCQTLNRVKNKIPSSGGYSGSLSNTVYCRRVTGIGSKRIESINDNKVHDYVDLSLSDCMPGIENDWPAAGDVIVQRGNKTDRERQGFTTIEVTGTQRGVKVYDNVDGYSMEGKKQVFIGYDSDKERAQLDVYGDAYIGANDGLQQNDGSTFIRYDALTHTLEVKAKILAESTVDNQALASYINGLIHTITDVIQGQVDAKAETWYQAQDPSLAWNTPALMRQHEGDMWYRTTDNTTWYWNGALWKQQFIPTEVFDTIDGKSSIYVAQPTSYKANDLWILAANATINGIAYKKGEVLTASADSDTFVAAHWSKKVMYTDDEGLLNFQANQYVQQLTNGSISDGISAASGNALVAQAAANAAQASANAANTKLTTWASDGYISPTEKTGLRIQWQDMINEYNQITAEATKYGISTSSFYWAYSYAYDAFQKYTSTSEENIAIGNDYGNIANYYAARQAILDSIATAAYNLAYNAQQAANTVNYIKVALKQKSVIDGGLILTSLIALRDGNNNTWSGINGVYDSGERGGGIAAWYGGGMIDHEAYPSLSGFAKTLFRMDGSGYLARGNISWNEFGDAEYKGKITAGSGEIAKFIIGADVIGSASEYDGGYARLFRKGRLLLYNGEDNGNALDVSKGSAVFYDVFKVIGGTNTLVSIQGDVQINANTITGSNTTIGNTSKTVYIYGKKINLTGTINEAVFSGHDYGNYQSNQRVVIGWDSKGAKIDGIFPDESAIGSEKWRVYVDSQGYLRVKR